MTESYLEMMKESLIQKIDVLEEIEKENAIQKEILENEEHFDSEGFDKAISRKGELIKKIVKLNDGFETLFERVKEELDGNRDKYRTQIAEYQSMIRRITDLSNAIEVQEKRNRDLATNHFRSSRDKINRNRKTSKAALDYYLTMNKSNVTPPQFYDTKN